MVTQVLAAIGLLVCMLLALRLALPARWRARVDRHWENLRRRVGHQVGRRFDHLKHWRQDRLRERAALEAADAAIRRAKARSRQVGAESAEEPDGEWDGNVYRPKEFNKPRPGRRNLH